MMDFFEADGFIIFCVAGAVCLALIVTGIVLLATRRKPKDGFDRRAASRAAYPEHVPSVPGTFPVGKPVAEPVLCRPAVPRPRPVRFEKPERPLSRPVLRSEREANNPADAANPVDAANPATLSESVWGPMREAEPLSRPEPARPVQMPRASVEAESEAIVEAESEAIVEAEPLSRPEPARAVQMPRASVEAESEAITEAENEAFVETEKEAIAETREETATFSEQQRLLMLKSHELLLTLADGVRKLSNAKTEASRKERLGELLTAIAALDAKSEGEGYQDFFRKMNPELWNKVLARASEELSPYEMRLCAMLSLGMGVREIAEIGGKSVRTVETAVYKLRKKLGIPTEAKASDFLRSL